MSTITTRIPSRTKKPFLMAAGGALVALAVATGLGTWQYSGPSDATSRTAGADRASAVALHPETGASSGADQEQYQQWLAHQTAAVSASGPYMTARPMTGTHEDEGSTLYIVATNGEAARLWEAIAIAPDRSPYQVMVLDPATDSTVLHFAEMSDIRHALGLPPITIIDTRGR
jgi:hypothetical protein